jgi:hypothetical protein
MSTQLQIPPPPTGVAPPSSSPKKPVWKRWWFWVLAVFLVIVAISAFNQPASEDVSTPQAADEPAPAADEPAADDAGAAIGDPVTDGQFTFTVNSVKCGESSIGSGVFAADAQGEYCLVSMKVQNTGGESQFMDSSNQLMFIGDKEYSTSSDALLALDDSENFFLEEINPGNAVEGVMVFDIPKGGQPDRLELHDSLFSGGVTVNI